MDTLQLSNLLKDLGLAHITPMDAAKLLSSVKPATTPATPEQIQRARQLYAERSDDDVEIDDNATISESENGVWVSAWVWVPA